MTLSNGGLNLEKTEKAPENEIQISWTEPVLKAKSQTWFNDSNQRTYKDSTRFKIVLALND